MIARTSRLLAATLGLVLLTTASSHAQGMSPGEAYLNALTQIARLELSALPLEVRAAMHQDPRWRQAYGRDGVVSAFAGMGEPDFAARVNHVFAVSRERATTHGGLTAFEPFADAETSILRSVLTRALTVLRTGRALDRVPVFDDAGAELGSLPPGAVVAVLPDAEPHAPFVRVQLRSGSVGRADRGLILLEAPRFEVAGRVNQVEGGTLLLTGAEPTLEVIADAGPGHPDPQLNEVVALLGPSGVTPPLRLDVVDRQIGDRRWVVIRSVELAEPPASVGAAGALRGLGRER